MRLTSACWPVGLALHCEVLFQIGACLADSLVVTSHLMLQPDLPLPAPPQTLDPILIDVRAAFHSQPQNPTGHLPINQMRCSKTSPAHAHAASGIVLKLAAACCKFLQASVNPTLVSEGPLMFVIFYLILLIMLSMS